VIVLEVRASNEAAIRLYSARGFEKIGVRRNFYNNPREDALIMRRGSAGLF
jgi:ribosomal-protein-alanine N-acetyltransferase